MIRCLPWWRELMEKTGRCLDLALGPRQPASPCCAVSVATNECRGSWFWQAYLEYWWSLFRVPSPVISRLSSWKWGPFPISPGMFPLLRASSKMTDTLSVATAAQSRDAVKFLCALGFKITPKMRIVPAVSLFLNEVSINIYMSQQGK